MARVRLLKGFEGGGLLWLAQTGAKLLYGKPFNQMGAIAHNRSFLFPYLQMNTFSSGKTQLSPQIRALAMGLTAELNGCEWCIDFARYSAQKAKVAPGKQTSLLDFANSPEFSEAEKAALEYTQVLCSPGASVGPALEQKLRQHFSERALVELTVAVAAEKFFNTVNSGLGIEPQGFARSPSLEKAQ